MKPRTLLMTTMCLALCLTIAAGAEETATQKTANAKNNEDAAKKQEILRKLETTKVSLEFSGASLQDVIDFLRETTHLNFVIHAHVTRELSAEQLQVSVRLNDITLKSALRLILKMRNLSLVYSNGVLLVVTAESITQQVVMRVYDVRDLLMKIQDFPGPDIELKMKEPGSCFPEEPTAAVENPEFIMNLVKTHTCGKSWDDNLKVSMKLTNGLLVVCQTPAGHKEVANLLNRLRQMK